MTKLVEGINLVNNTDYHADKTYLSSSSLKLLLDDPRQFKLEYIDKIPRIREIKAAFDEGTYAHTALLEPHLVNSDFAFFEGWRKAGGEWEVFKAANADKIILSKPQKIKMDDLIKKALDLNKDLKLLELSNGFSEHTLAITLNGFKLKARADFINVNDKYIIDVKTSSFDTDVDNFKYTLDSFKYDLSSAMYLALFEHYYGCRFDFYFFVLGKTTGTVDMHRLSDATRQAGHQKFTKAVNLYRYYESVNWDLDSVIPSKQSSEYEIKDV